MNQTYALIPKPEKPLELYEPHPQIAYTLEAAARLSDLPRHTILVCYKYGLVSPVLGSERGGYRFDRAAIRRLRCIERLRSTYGMRLSSIKLMLELMDEVERLQTELRFLRR